MQDFQYPNAPAYPEPAYPPVQPRAKTDWLSIAQLVFSVGSLLSSLAIAALMFFTDFMPMDPQLGAVNSGPLMLLAYASLVVAALALISAVYAVRRLMGWRSPGQPAKRSVWLYGLLALWPFLLAWGSSVSASGDSGGLSALLVVLGLAVPTFWLLRYGSGDLWGAYPQRDSGLFTLGAGFSLYFIMFLELVAIALLLVGVVLVAPMLPGLQQILQELGRIFQEGPQVLEDPRILERLTGMLNQPGIIGLLILAIGLIAPFLEELFKPLGVWLLAGRKPSISPTQGYVAGLFSGAAFGLVEGMLYGMQVIGAGSGELFLGFMLGRAAGLLLHIFLSGLNGWAIAKSWQDKRWGRILGMLALTTLIHGAWNSLAILNGLNNLDSEAVFDLSHPISLVPMALILIGMLLGFLVFSKRVQRELHAPETV